MVHLNHISQDYFRKQQWRIWGWINGTKTQHSVNHEYISWNVLYNLKFKAKHKVNSRHWQFQPSVYLNVPDETALRYNASDLSNDQLDTMGQSPWAQTYRMTCTVYPMVCINTLRPRQDGRHFADNIFKCIFLNENVWIPIKNSLKFVPKGPINNIPTLVQIMAWRRSGDKTLSEPMMVSSLTHICVTRPQWVNTKRCIFFTQSDWLGCKNNDGILNVSSAYYVVPGPHFKNI